MRSIFHASDYAETDHLIHANTPRFSLKNSFMKAQALSGITLWMLVTVLVLIHCLTTAAILYLFNFGLVPSELNAVIRLLLFATFTFLIFSSVVAFFIGVFRQQQPSLINTLYSQRADFTVEQAIAVATSSIHHKISIDLHDSTIQPYIGLMLGLKALRRKIPHGEAIAVEMDELINMTAESIAELRQYIGDFKSHLEMPLLPAVLDIAKKYQHRHGIEVIFNADPEISVSERLATQVYQLIREGLSNIHRHTAAKQAEINLYSQHDQLVIEFINQVDNAQDFIDFKPRSMTERVTHLGGTVSVNHRAGDKTADIKTAAVKTIVIAKIPLKAKDKLCVAPI